MTASLRTFFVASLLLLATLPAASAQERAVFLSLGTASWLALDSSFETVIVGDPLIVDVHTGDDRTVVIEPLQPGATNLVFVNTRGLVIANIRILVCASVRSAAAASPGSSKCGQQVMSDSTALIARAGEVTDQGPL
jgi:Flp pilus assembly secretin CpaC